MLFYVVLCCYWLFYGVICCLLFLLLEFIWRRRKLYVYLIQLSQVEYLIDIQVFSSFCVDRKKKQERTANTLRRRTNGLSGVWLRNSRLRRSDSPRPRRHRKASFVTDGSRYRSPR